MTATRSATAPGSRTFPEAETSGPVAWSLFSNGVFTPGTTDLRFTISGIVD